MRTFILGRGGISFLVATIWLLTRIPSSAAEAPGASPLSNELREIMAADDRARAEIDRWGGESAGDGALDAALLASRISNRLREVEQRYDAYLDQHPKDPAGWNAFASFLNEQGRGLDALTAWNKAKELNPEDASVWNNLANYHAQNGDASKALRYLDRALTINPKEAVYLENLATMILVFVPEARERYELTEAELGKKAMNLYQRALEVTPDEFTLAAAYASAFYRIEKREPSKAIAAWNRAMELTSDEIERQGVLLHIARWRILAAEFDLAREVLSQIELPMYVDERSRLTQALPE